MKKSLLAILLFLNFSFAFALEPLNINTASAEEIAEKMIGIGSVKAEAIIQYRNNFGPFETAEDITGVKGIGSKTIEKNRNILMFK